MKTYHEPEHDPKEVEAAELILGILATHFGPLTVAGAILKNPRKPKLEVAIKKES